MFTFLMIIIILLTAAIIFLGIEYYQLTKRVVFSSDTHQQIKQRKLELKECDKQLSLAQKDLNYLDLNINEQRKVLNKLKEEKALILAEYNNAMSLAKQHEEYAQTSVRKEYELQFQKVEAELQKENNKLTEIQQERNKQEQLLQQFKTLTKEQEEQATEAVRKEYELQRAAMKADHERKLRQAINEVAESGELKKLQQEIEDARATVKAIQDEKKAQSGDEDFEAKHSIAFSKQDKEDIDIIHDAVKKLNKKDIFNTILWQLFYQKPLQDMRARVFGKVSNRVCGIYKISLKSDPTKVYLGQARDISQRFTEHVKAALNGEKSKFYTFMNKEGPENFLYTVVEECDESKLNERERYWICFYNATEYGLNTSQGG